MVYVCNNFTIKISFLVLYKTTNNNATCNQFSFRMGPKRFASLHCTGNGQEKNHGQMVKKKETYQIPAPGCVSDLICTQQASNLLFFAKLYGSGAGADLQQF